MVGIVFQEYSAMKGLRIVLPSARLAWRCAFGLFCTLCGGVEVQQGKSQPFPSFAVSFPAVWLPA